MSASRTGIRAARTRLYRAARTFTERGELNARRVRATATKYRSGARLAYGTDAAATKCGIGDMCARIVARFVPSHYR